MKRETESMVGCAMMLGAIVAATGVIVLVVWAIVSLTASSGGPDSAGPGLVWDPTGIDNFVTTCTDQGHRVYFGQTNGGVAVIADEACRR